MHPPGARSLIEPPIGAASKAFRCAPHARAVTEPRYGTASQVRRWILIEQPGPWGADALAQSRLPERVATALHSAARAVRARPLLIRRHGRYVVTRLTCLVAVTTPSMRRVERLLFTDPHELEEVDWSRLGQNLPIGGEPVTEPVFLVCTNGRHDACCAQFGRPLAASLSEARPAETWESSHFGGDRFAGNLVCLPHGLYYGHASPLDGPRLAEAYEQGRVDLDHYRGFSCYPFAVQAAEYFIRREHAIDGLDDLLLENARTEAGELRATFTDRDGRRLTVVLAIEPDPEPRCLTCKATHAIHPARYHLVTLQVG